MTALKEYQRLETLGLWHASPTEQRRDVIVSLGEATLTITDQQMVPLSHWSLPAVRRLNPGERPALFGPGAEMSEVLELDDETMIAAIEKVRSVIQRRRAQPGRLRQVLIGVAVAALAVATVAWLPGALIRQAVAVVPEAQRIEIGHSLLNDMRRVTGSPCDTPLGRRALDRLQARLLPDAPGRILVMRDGVKTAEHLPGGLILVGRDLVESYEDPDVLAGFVLAQAAEARNKDPLKRLLEQAGVFASLRLLATGTLSRATLTAHAEGLLTHPDATPGTEELLANFRAADVPSTPYAFAVDITGESTLGLIEADPVAPGAGRPVLSDGDWVSLQGICGE